MALKALYLTETEIPEGLKEHYAEKDGKWLLQTDPPAEDVSGLKNALNQERNLRREAEKQSTDLKIKFEGIEPDEVVRLRERVKGLDESDIYDKQGIEALVSRRTESMKADHERVMRTKDQEITTLRDSVATTDRRWRQDRIKTELVESAAKAGIQGPGAMRDAISRGLEIFVDLDEEGAAIARDGADPSAVRYGKDGINPLRPLEFYLSRKADPDWQHLWPSSSGSGAPPHRGPNGQTIDWASLPPAERLTKFREQQAAGRNTP
jgi:hypothetical protein